MSVIPKPFIRYLISFTILFILSITINVISKNIYKCKCNNYSCFIYLLWKLMQLYNFYSGIFSKDTIKIKCVFIIQIYRTIEYCIDIYTDNINIKEFILQLICTIYKIIIIYKTYKQLDIFYGWKEYKIFGILDKNIKRKYIIRRRLNILLKYVCLLTLQEVIFDYFAYNVYNVIFSMYVLYLLVICVISFFILHMIYNRYVNIILAGYIVIFSIYTIISATEDV
ncbi:hypothetical protein SLOPH_543 [Spraguea lophii 42_110]|uniref:Uncharacterized protein n=1 Tax=Spraguea lophii (strain 42_110) TaxID=1358809 RepID=S7XM18_SPRLO|nr:hypothetical protein SLOPH_543 [Spraguea lophii 42_110]